jgi:hypothetical protein
MWRGVGNFAPFDPANCSAAWHRSIWSPGFDPLINRRRSRGEGAMFDPFKAVA